MTECFNNLFTLKSNNPKDYIPNRFYIAYGSNMSLSRLKSRCPNSEFVGIGVVEGYKLIFRRSASGFFASIDKVDYKKKKKRKSLWSVPVAIFKISRNDEDNLDRFEGCPRWYKKIELEVTDSQESKIKGIGYVLPETAKIGIPDSSYYSIILNAYKSLGIDSKTLEKAFLISYKKSDLKTQKHQTDNKNNLVFYNSNKAQSGLFSSNSYRMEYPEIAFSSNADRFFKEFERELDSKLSYSFGLNIEVTKENLYIQDSESGETYFMIYPPSGNTFYLENVMDNDFMDYISIEEAVLDINNYFFNRGFY